MFKNVVAVMDYRFHWFQYPPSAFGESIEGYFPVTLACDGAAFPSIMASAIA
jgi:hypothetical protein